MDYINWRLLSGLAVFNMCLTSSDGTDARAKSAYPDYKRMSARIKSFKNWPVTHCQDPHLLAEAGFFSTGFEDLVMCFYCGTAVDHWERTDNPFLEHSRFGPHCLYNLIVKA